METLARAIGGFVIGGFGWVLGNLAGMVGYVLTILLLMPLIAVGVVASHFVGNVLRHRRGEPKKQFRWR